MFICALAGLSLRVDRVGLAESFVDPVAHIPAQDEAVYASVSLHMAASGGWLTPMFLGRYAFFKPPLLYWLSGGAAKLLGAWALRLPSLLAGALVVTVLFLWAGRGTAGIAAGLLLISNHMFHVLARTALTDMLLALWIVAAMACAARDPKLAGSFALWIAGVAAGLAIMTKGVAGVLPLLMLAAVGIPWRRLVSVCAIAACVAAPWHVYQLAAHTRWFWAEYVRSELFTWGLAAPEQSVSETALLYYAKRLFLTDPVLCIAALAALPALVRERKRLLAAWIAVMALAMLAFQYRNTSYLLPLLPALALLGSRFANRYSVAALAAVLIVKAWCWDQPWGLPYRAEHPMPSVAGLESYAGRHRTNELILIAPDDEFVSATLPLPHIRYVFLDARPARPKLPLDFEDLGITVTTDRFVELDRWRPQFEQRLAAWGLPSGEPIATVVLARSADDVRRIVASRPRSDFSLPRDLAGIGDAAHEFWSPPGGRVYLLSAEPRASATGTDR